MHFRRKLHFCMGLAAAALLTLTDHAGAELQPFQSITHETVADLACDSICFVAKVNTSEAPPFANRVLVGRVDAQGGISVLDTSDILPVTSFQLAGDLLILSNQYTEGIGWRHNFYRINQVGQLQGRGSQTVGELVLDVPDVAKVRDVLCAVMDNAIWCARVPAAGNVVPLGQIPLNQPRLCQRQTDNRLLALSHDTLYLYTVTAGQLPVLSHSWPLGYPVDEAVPGRGDVFLVSPTRGVVCCRIQSQSLIEQSEAPWPGGGDPHLRFSDATDSLLLFRSDRGIVGLDVRDRAHLRWCGPLPFDKCCVGEGHNTIITMDNRYGVDSLLVSRLDEAFPDLDLRGETSVDPLPLDLHTGITVLSGSTCPFQADFQNCQECLCVTESYTDPHGDSNGSDTWHSGNKDVFYSFLIEDPGVLTIGCSANYMADIVVLGPSGVLACGSGPLTVRLDAGSYQLVVDGTLGRFWYNGHNGYWSYPNLDGSGRYSVTLDWSPDVGVPAALHAETFALRAPAPNPFNPSTWLTLWMPEAGAARVAIHNAAGQLVRVLQDGSLAAGEHTMNWDGRTAEGAAAASGLYLAVAENGGAPQVRRILLIR